VKEKAFFTSFEKGKNKKVKIKIFDIISNLKT